MNPNSPRKSVSDSTDLRELSEALHDMSARVFDIVPTNIDANSPVIMRFLRMSILSGYTGSFRDLITRYYDQLSKQFPSLCLSTLLGQTQYYQDAMNVIYKSLDGELTAPRRRIIIALTGTALLMEALSVKDLATTNCYVFRHDSSNREDASASRSYNGESILHIDKFDPSFVGLPQLQNWFSEYKYPAVQLNNLWTLLRADMIYLTTDKRIDSWFSKQSTESDVARRDLISKLSLVVALDEELSLEDTDSMQDVLLPSISCTLLFDKLGFQLPDLLLFVFMHFGLLETVDKYELDQALSNDAVQSIKKYLFCDWPGTATEAPGSSERHDAVTAVLDSIAGSSKRHAFEILHKNKIITFPLRISSVQDALMILGVLQNRFYAVHNATRSRAEQEIDLTNI